DQGAGVPDGATAVRAAAGEGQVVQGDGDAAGDLKDAAAVIAVDGQPVGAGAIDRQGVSDVQLAAGQADGAGQAGGEVDHVGAGAGVGGQDGRPQRAFAAVGQVQDREGAGNGPVLQGLDRQRRPPRAAAGPAAGRPGPGQRGNGPQGGQDRSE